MTLAEYRVQVAAKMGLDNTPGSRDVTLMNAWANQGYMEVMAESRIKVGCATLHLAPGFDDYTLDPMMLAINEVYLTSAEDNLTYPFDRVSPQEILDMRIGSQGQTAPPVRYYALNGADRLMVYPTPTGSDELFCYFVARPAALVVDEAEPSDIPYEWQKVIEYFMLFQAGQYINDKFSQNGATYQTLYREEIARMKRAALHRGGRRLSPAVVGRRRRFIGSPSQTRV